MRCGHCNGELLKKSSKTGASPASFRLYTGLPGATNSPLQPTTTQDRLRYDLVLTAKSGATTPRVATARAIPSTLLK